MKKEKGNFRRRIAVLSSVCVVLFAGCGAEDSVPKGNETVGEEQAEQMPEDDKTAPSDEENAEKAQALYEAQIRHYYGGVLSQIIAAWQLPDGELDTSSLSDGFGEMRDNHFAVIDIDGDGREELIIQNTAASMAGMFERVYDYNPISGELKQEFVRFPSLTYYDNGIIKAEWSHNQGPGEFWPFTLYRYEPDSDSYVEIGVVDTWDKALREEWYEGQPFPDELDTDGDGTMYHICKEGEEYSCEYEDYKYNQADFDEWFGGYMEGAKELSIEYQPMEYESFADFTPAYLKILADEAGQERTDTDSDLGLLILHEDHFLDVAQALLSEKYGVELEQPEPDFEEYTVGTISGRQIFSFTALDSGDLSYFGEKVGDVTIFGIYPGTSVDGAWAKLKSYGFYASPYGEVENCLITGEGFGNVSIWFSAEDGIVTEITVRPYCAFAG